MIKNIFILFLALFILGGCSSKKRVVAPVKTLPQWYVNQTQSDERTLYSVGEGEDQPQAVANALSNMAATLSVSISSEFNIKSVVRDGLVSSVQTDSSNEVNTKVEALRISNYQVIHSLEFGFQRHLVLIKSDKNTLFISLNKEINQNFESIQIKYDASQKYNLIKRLSVSKEAKELTRGMRHTVLVMHSLNPNFNDANYLAQILAIESRYDSLLSKLTFSIDSDYDAKNLMSSIANGLSIEKYKITKKTDSENHFKIRITSSTSQAKSYGFDLARSAIAITVKDSSGIVIGSNKLNITGQSTQGYKIAKENIALKLNSLILQEGVAKIIGLEL